MCLLSKLDADRKQTRIASTSIIVLEFYLAELVSY